MTYEMLLDGSIAVIFAWLVLGGLGLPLPEDAALLATGVVIYHGSVPAALAVTVAAVGVLAGDIILFCVARSLGPAAYARPLFQKLIPPRRRARFEEGYAKHGGKIVFLARHVIGLRAATFAMAGIHGMPLRRFVVWDALAASISVPLMISLGYFGALHMDRVRRTVAATEHDVALAAIAIGVIAYAVVRRRRRTARR